MKIFDEDYLNKWGIVDFGFTTQAEPLTSSHYNKWVEDKKHLPLTYLEGERQLKRQNIKEYWPEFASAIVFLFSYHKSHQALQSLYKSNENWNGLKLASYTLGFEGLDYHDLIKERLLEIGKFLNIKFPNLEYKLTLDTHPVLERDLAMRAGLGWFGKNSMLINRKQGSFFIIGSLLLNQDLALESKTVEVDHCGQCTRCIDACPTEAITPYHVDGSKCIRYFTIELKENMPIDIQSNFQDWIFGCDICQDVCPWNRFSKAHEEKRFLPSQKLLGLNYDDWQDLSEDLFKELFHYSAIKRTKFSGIRRNIKKVILDKTNLKGK
jgi:epoxyqueuosine reductase